MISETAATDLSWEEYTARQYRELADDRLLERAMQVRPSGNYRFENGRWVPQPYPGYAVLSMVAEHSGNEGLPETLAAVQNGLAERCPWENALYLLPPDSYHQTVANMLSEQRFMRHIADAGLEKAYPGMVDHAFQQIEMKRKGPVEMRLIGLSIFGTALGVLGIFDQPEHYQRILRFRAGLYSDPGLAALDVRMTRPFIGHITLAYIENELSAGQRTRLAEAAAALNGQIKEVRPVFRFSGTGLRRYEQLSSFARADGYPRYEF